MSDKRHRRDYPVKRYKGNKKLNINISKHLSGFFFVGPLMFVLKNRSEDQHEGDASDTH
jgi:hypothetical protein